MKMTLTKFINNTMYYDDLDGLLELINMSLCSDIQEMDIKEMFCTYQYHCEAYQHLTSTKNKEFKKRILVDAVAQNLTPTQFIQNYVLIGQAPQEDHQGNLIQHLYKIEEGFTLKHVYDSVWIGGDMLNEQLYPVAQETT